MDIDGERPLHWLAKNHSIQFAWLKKSPVDVARLLIDSGANTDGIDLSWMNDQEDA